MNNVPAKYIKDEDDNVISPIVGAKTVFAEDGTNLETVKQNMYKIPVDPTDTTNINIWIQTS